MSEKCHIKDVWGFFAPDFNFRSYSPQRTNTGQDYPGLTAEELFHWDQSVHSDNLAWVMGKLQSGHATYPSKVLPRMENMSLDFYQRYCELSKAAGKYIMAYTCGGDDVYAHRQQPEWFREYGSMFACLNSPFWDREFEAVGEMLRLFPADGFFYDMVRFSGYCTCEFCKAAYQNFYGERMPQRYDTKTYRPDFSDERRDTLRFRLDTYKQWVRRATQAARDIVPGIEVVLNQQWERPAGLPFELLDQFDFYFSEYGHAEWMVELMRAWGDKPVLCGVSLEPRDCAHLLGRRICPYNAETIQDHRTGKLLSTEHRFILPSIQSLDELKKREPYVMDAVSIPHATVLYAESGDLYNHLNFRNYTDTVALCVREATRMNLTCCTVEHAERMSADTLNKYELIFASDMSCQDEVLAARLCQWVSQGGILVANGQFALIDQQGKLLPDYADHRLLGIQKMEGPLEVFSMLTDYRLGGENQVTNDPIELGNVVVCASTTAEPVGYGNVGADENVPLLWLNKVGKGMVFYLSGSISGQGYHQRSEKSRNAWRNCLQKLIWSHLRQAPFRTTTEYPTEIWLNEQPEEKRLVMHIVAFEKPLVGQVVSVRADLIADDTMEIVYPDTNHAVIHGERRDGYVQFLLPEIHEHVILVANSATKVGKS